MIRFIEYYLPTYLPTYLPIYLILITYPLLWFEGYELETPSY